MSWYPKDEEEIRFNVKRTIEALTNNESGEENIKTIMNSLARICYCIGCERGYSVGQKHAKLGIDERKSPAQIQLNSTLCSRRENNELESPG